MTTKASDRETVKVEHANGGAGFIMKEALLGGEALGQHCKMFSRVTIKPGCELGYHEHHGETETYYVLSGSALYSDNGEAYRIGAGDVTFCKDGDGHGVKNDGDEDLVFVALILKN